MLSASRHVDHARHINDALEFVTAAAGNDGGEVLSNAEYVRIQTLALARLWHWALTHIRRTILWTSTACL